MKIQSAKVIVTCPGRNFVTLKIETDQGVYGIGDGTLNGREKSVVSYLEDHVVPCLIGMDPRRIEDIWQYLYKGAYWRRGPVTMRAIAAVDMALWDIKAKMAGMPKKVLEVANQLLAQLEGQREGKSTSEKIVKKSKTEITTALNQAASAQESGMQLSFFQLNDPVLENIKEELERTDINTLTPVEALMKLNEIKKMIGG